jgi:hypothetical protein
MTLPEVWCYFGDEHDDESPQTSRSRRDEKPAMTMSEVAAEINRRRAARGAPPLAVQVLRGEPNTGVPSTLAQTR